jgi:succinyl-diaminopimelate desuccinylase
MHPLGFDPRDPLALAQALIRRASVTPDAAGPLGIVEACLEGAGFEVHRPVFSEADTPDVENLYARIGPPGPALVFAGHVDVVPPGDEKRWTHGPYSGAIVGDALFGRGAVDMKGGVAASVAATLRHLEKRRDGPLAFLITGDEEGPAVNGTAKLLDWARARGETFAQCILAEPTNTDALGDMVKIGRRGSLSGTITVHGIQGHVAYPHLAKNPVPVMLALLSSLTATALDHGTSRFDPSNLEVTTIDVGNKAFNVIPAQARASFNIRFNDGWTRETLEAWVRSRLAEAAHKDVPYDVAFERGHSEAFLTEPGPFVDILVDAIEAETGRRPRLSTTGGTSDARFIKAHCPVVEFGLVGRTMHQIDEHVNVADLEALTRIYEHVLESYFKA